MGSIIDWNVYARRRSAVGRVGRAQTFLDRGGGAGPGVGRLYPEPADRHRRLSRPASAEADPGGGPGRRRQDRACQVGGRLPRPHADPHAVLRGAGRVEGAVRVEIRQAAALHPDPEGQDRRRARAQPTRCPLRSTSCTRSATSSSRAVPGAAATAAGIAAARRRGAADRRDRQVGPGVRGVPAGDPVRLPGHHPGDRQRGSAGDADRSADVEQHARSG